MYSRGERKAAFLIVLGMTIAFVIAWLILRVLSPVEGPNVIPA
jgi:hypothetical protein